MSIFNTQDEAQPQADSEEQQATDTNEGNQSFVNSCGGCHSRRLSTCPADPPRTPASSPRGPSTLRADRRGRMVWVATRCITGPRR